MRDPSPDDAPHVAPSDASIESASIRSRAPRWSDVLPVAVISGLVATLFSLRPFVASELRYVDAGRAMLSRGDWVVPHLAGVPYMEKPILFYWLSAGAQWLLGVSNVAARVPSILGCVAMLTTAFALAFELRGRRFAWATAGLLVGSIGVLPMATTLTTDALFAGSLSLTWYALWRHLRSPRSAWKWCFWVSLAAAMLAKGPLGPAMIVASCAVIAIAERRLSPFLKLRPFVGGLLFVALCAPWHVALWMRDPRLVEFFYVRQNLRAAVDGKVNHSGPTWYYAPVLLGLLFPYSVLVVTAAVNAARRLISPQRGAAAVRVRLLVFLSAVFVGPLLLLTLSASKLGTYVLPILPFLGVLVAREAVRAVERPGRIGRVATLTPALLLIVGAGVALPQVLDRYDIARFRPEYLPMVTAAFAALLVGLAASVWLAWCGRRRVFVPMGAGVLLALGLAIPVVVDPGARFDAREAAHVVAELRDDGDLIVAAGGDAEDYSIQMVLGGRSAILGRAREMGMGHFVEHRGRSHAIPPNPTRIDSRTLPDDPWLLGDRDLVEHWRGARRVWLFGDEEDVEALRAHSELSLYTLYDDGKHMVFSNHPIGRVETASGAASRTIGTR